jgi:acetoin utilization deacetylase AcuC-like enzyme
MNKIPVFFDNQMVVDKIFETPSPRKPLEVVTQWQNKYPISLHSFAPVLVDDFYLAHKKEHVDGIIDLSISNGMDTKDQEVVDSLYWTSGSMLAASRHALEHGVAVSPTSGFHHAGYDYSWGFCTFNGLLVTAQKLLKENGLTKVGILDFDYHRGDGSQDIIEKLCLQDSIIHITGENDYKRKKNTFFEQLPSLFERLKNVDIILYQAGADQHEKDPLGGFLNDEQLRLRDELVFNFASSYGIPIAWNLAGGYQEEKIVSVRSIQKVLNIHNATMEECIKAYLNKT